MGKIKACYPPGYEYGKERAAAKVLLASAAVLSLRYFIRLYRMWKMLYDMSRAYEGQAGPGMEAVSFLLLFREYAVLFLPYFLFLVIMAVQHYLYYYRDTRSIYLMRRIPGKWVLVESCVGAPLLGMAAGGAVLVLLGILYYGAYLLAIPGEWNPRIR